VVSITAKSLEQALMEDEEELAEAVQHMQEDLVLVQQPAGFKRWLTQQRKLSQQMAREQARLARFQDWDDF